MIYHSLEEIFAAFNGLKVLIVGDVMVDSYLWGKVDRISPEAPVPIVHVQKREKRLGGAANVALNVQEMGATPVLCSIIGNDADGGEFIKLLESKKMPTQGIVASDTRVTTIKHRILSGSQQMLRVDSEVDHTLSKQENDLLLQKVKQLAPACDVVIFQDYDKGVLCKENIEAIIEIATAHGIPTIVDPKKRNFLHYRGVTLFKPNLKELREGLKVDVDVKESEALQKVVSLLRQKMHLTAALVTLSERGVYIDYAEAKHLIPAHIRQISDVSGAGDTVVSIAALCLALQLSPRLIASLSNLGGGLVCEYVGVVPIHKESLLAEALKNHFFEMYADN